MDFKEWSAASKNADKSMSVPAGLMSFANDRRGKPTNEQRTLYLGAIVFIYAVWENYVEEVALELARAASSLISPEAVPSGVQQLITKGATPWELSVSPGWRQLWVSRVEAMTVGDGSSWGLNTASSKNVKAVFKALAINPLPDRLAAPGKTDRSGRAVRLPQRVSIREKDNTVDVRNCIDQLIMLRGEAVHTGTVKATLLKAEIFWWEEFVRSLYEETDRSARRAIANDVLQLFVEFPR